MKKKVSVIVPVYNVGEYLDQCLESVVSQTFTDMEILLIDDGSTDVSGAVCKEWAGKDGRIRYIRKANEGLGPTRQMGIREAQGECVLFIDGDDWVERRYVERLATPVLNGEAEIAICDYRKVWCDDSGCIVREREYKTPIAEEGAVCPRESLDYLFYGRFFMWLKAYKKDLLLRCRAKQPAGATEDSPVSFLYLYEAAKILHVKKTLYNYRQRRGSLIYSDKLYQYARNALRITKENIDAYAPELKGSYITKKIAAANVIGYRFVHGETQRAESLRQYFYELFLPDPAHDVGSLKCCSFGSYNLRAMVSELEYMPPKHYGFSSLIAAMSCRKEGSVALSHGNPFREEALRGEIQGEFYRALFHADYVFLDLLEERFDIAVLDDGTYLTKSDAFEEALYNGPPLREAIRQGDGRWSALWEASVEKLAEAVKKAGVKRVVLVQTRLAEHFGAQGKERQYPNAAKSRRFNERLERMERRVADRVENVTLVSLPAELVYTDRDFAHGCYPWHLNDYLYCKMPGRIRRALEGAQR